MWKEAAGRKAGEEGLERYEGKVDFLGREGAFGEGRPKNENPKTSWWDWLVEIIVTKRVILGKS